VLEYELRECDAGNIAEIREVIHFYHRVRNRIQDVTDVKRSGDIGA